MSNQRIRPQTASPEGYAALATVERYISQSGLPRNLIELVKMRASQINGCAYCLDVHSKDARRSGETEKRLYLLNAWDEADCYTPAERAALAWTESLTRVADARASSQVFEPLREYFTEKEITDLTILIGMINLWNRLAIGMRYELAAEKPLA